MRLRNVKGSRERIAADDFVVHEPAEYKGHWQDAFGKKRPLYLEIGMGKGKFISELATAHPEYNYLGIEKFSSVLVRALDKRAELTVDNLLFLRMDAEEIADIFDLGEVDGIYLNFSDPWPKDRHAKRRLTSDRFLKRYAQILKPEGEVVFKTDNEELFAFSLEQAEAEGWEIVSRTQDLHHSEEAEENVMTEYEERFSKEGKKICRMVIRQGKR
jgi:tRNA (guanine-N7-)-methyltransferase